MKHTVIFSPLTRLVDRAIRAKFRKSTRYFGAVAIVAISLGLTFFFHSDTGKLAVAFNLFAVVVAAIFGGFGPGVAASLVSALGIDYYFLEPIGSVDLDGFTHAIIFSLISVLVSLLVSSLRTALKNAEQANYEKDMVMAFISHDLRNPLSSILLALQMIRRREAKGDSEVKNLTSTAETACRRMARMIEEILTSAKIESGGLKLETKPCDLAAILRSVVDEHKILAKERGLQLSLSGDLGNGLLFSCDETLLSQVVANLLGNAFKFTPSGGAVRVELEETDEQVKVRVIDSGKGIPAKDISHVFEKFWQSDGKSKAGAGLGMFLSRAIVEAHHGSIEVKSEVGKGTAFSLALPKEPSIGQASKSVSFS